MSQKLLRSFRNSSNCKEESCDVALRSSCVELILSGFWIDGKCVFKILLGSSYDVMK